MQRQRYAQALAAAEALLVEVPENRDVLYMLAVSYRHLNRMPEAFAMLERLEQLDPGFSRLYQERGHCFVALQDVPNAIAAYLQARPYKSGPAGQLGQPELRCIGSQGTLKVPPGPPITSPH